MREVVSFDEVMVFVDAFTESVTPVINGPISKASFMILAEMDPTIADELNVVTNWVNNNPDIVDDNLSISNTVSDDVVVDDEVVKRHYKKIKKSDVLDIARHISETYNNRKLSYVEGRLFKKYPNETEDALMDLLYKRTFSRYTDDYYIINNGVINSLNDDTKKPETPKAATTVPSSDPTEVSSVFKDAKDALNRIPEMLKKHDGDVISTITPDMTWEDISKIALTRYVLFTKGHYDNIGGGVKEILIMHVIKHENIKHNVDIRSYMKNKYKLEVSSQLVSSIKRGAVYKDIASKFGVI
jgi:hypothetical protein